MSSQSVKWWKEGVAYQIWPASYKDSNGDGLGDIPGVISMLDHQRELGVDYIWLSPMYASPQNDMGYDISDYEDVYQPYGTLQDMENLISEVHKRGMKIILDLVINHTSSEHRWFQQSKMSRDNAFSHWYIWRDPRKVNGERRAPNNWRSQFGGSAWTYAPEREQYYLHLFHETMPDLNWQNADARRAIHRSALEYWLKRGVDGFRVDVVNFYDKNQEFPDATETDPSAETQHPDAEFYLNGPNIHTWLKEIRTETMDKYGRDLVMVGELWGTKREEVLRYTSAQERELDMVFDFGVFAIGGEETEANQGKKKSNHDFLGRHKLSELKRALMESQDCLVNESVPDAWPTVFLENHDLPRSVTRYGSPDPRFQTQSARTLALMLCTLSGTLFLYQGQEIGMSNIPESWSVQDLRDGASINYLRAIEEQYPGNQQWREKAMAGVRKMGRDNTRTPVQWSSKNKYAGFSDDGAAEPWIKVNENFKQGVNVKDQTDNPNSVLEFWKKAIKLRKQYKEWLVYGRTKMLDETNERTMTYLKSGMHDDLRPVHLVCLNFSESEESISMPEGWSAAQAELKLSTYHGEHAGIQDALQPWEGRVYVLTR